MRKAIDVKPGDVIRDFGRVSAVNISHRDVAVTESTGHSSTNKVPSFLTGLVRARLQAEAIEQCYRQVPVSVVIHNGSKSVKLKPSDSVFIEGESAEPAKAA